MTSKNVTKISLTIQTVLCSSQFRGKLSSLLLLYQGLMGDSNRVKLRDGRFLAYRESGVPKEDAKYKIILVHGFGSSKDLNFSASKELVEELGVYLLFYDRSGYGESDSNTKHSLKSEVDDIAELADQLEIGPKFYLIASSMGAYPTWGCLKHIPHRLSGVAFVAPVVNYLWPSLPKKLIKNDYRGGLFKWWAMALRCGNDAFHREKAIEKAIGSVSTVVRSRRFFSAVRCGRFSLASISTAVRCRRFSFSTVLFLDGSLSRRFSFLMVLLGV
ncbi:hypothetical protein Rs2_49236 [Raphanus sativus]|nr:hypothetical protein Rs2_49236 [Raphanus sativus]